MANNKAKLKSIAAAKELFEFGVTWMLREAELATIKLNNIVLDFEAKRVSLTIPVSKTDQAARQVSRVLQCLCESKECQGSCPFYTAVRLFDKVRTTGSDWICFSTKGRRGAKAQLVQEWRKLYGSKVSGHSARRTGALAYIRNGWSIAQVAFVGRWKSAVIYEYAAEALASLPVNNPTTFASLGGQGRAGGEGYSDDATAKSEGMGYVINDSGQTVDIEAIKIQLTAEVEAAKHNQAHAIKILEDEINQLRVTFEKNTGGLPQFVLSTTTKIVHRNTDLTVCCPHYLWRTRCGWCYSRSDFAFVAYTGEWTKCQKCFPLAPSK